MSTTNDSPTNSDRLETIRRRVSELGPGALLNRVEIQAYLGVRQSTFYKLLREWRRRGLNLLGIRSQVRIRKGEIDQLGLTPYRPQRAERMRQLALRLGKRGASSRISRCAADGIESTHRREALHPNNGTKTVVAADGYSREMREGASQ